MAASFLAGFLIFILTGWYSLASGLSFAKDPAIRIFVIMALSGNALYYFYTAAYTEMEAEIRNKLAQASRWEWSVRVVNQTLLLSLWFALDQGWRTFSVVLLLVYLSYLLWDLLTRKALGGLGLLFVLDVFGLGISAVFLLSGGQLQAKLTAGTPHDVEMFFWGASSIGYVVIAVVGIASLRFNPFAKQYMTRPELR